MGKFLPDLAVTVDDKESAAGYYERVFGLPRGRTTDQWIELLAGPFRIFLCDDEPAANTMFAFATEDVEGVVAKIVSAGGEEIGRSGTEVFVRDRYGVFFCIEPESD